MCPTQVHYETDLISTATNNFSTLIGSGSFGSVYLGFLNDEPVAVKRSNDKSKTIAPQYQVLLNPFHQITQTALQLLTREAYVSG